MTTTTRLEPLWHGLRWDQLTEDQWKALNRTDPTLWYRMWMVSEGHPDPATTKRAKPLNRAAAAPAPSASTVSRGYLTRDMSLESRRHKGEE